MTVNGPAPAVNVIALDPANRCGWAMLWSWRMEPTSGVENLEPATAKKARPAKPEKRHKRTEALLRAAIPETPAVPAEADDERLVNLWALLNRLGDAACWKDFVVVHEAPLKHHAGVRAAQLAFWWQAAIALWCRENRVRRIEVPPYDLQRFVLGRGATPGTNEMLDAAKSRLGYEGDDHNEADAWWLREWTKTHVLANSVGNAP